MSKERKLLENLERLQNGISREEIKLHLKYLADCTVNSYAPLNDQMNMAMSSYLIGRLTSEEGQTLTENISKKALSRWLVADVDKAYRKTNDNRYNMYRTEVEIIRPQRNTWTSEPVDVMGINAVVERAYSVAEKRVAEATNGIAVIKTPVKEWGGKRKTAFTNPLSKSNTATANIVFDVLYGHVTEKWAAKVTVTRHDEV